MDTKENIRAAVLQVIDHAGRVGVPCEDMADEVGYFVEADDQEIDDAVRELFLEHTITRATYTDPWTRK